MKHDVAGRYWGDGPGEHSFTGGDILAIQNMYGTANYHIDIDGPLRLLPGEAGTYNIIGSDLLQDYVGDFNTTWEVFDAEIVSETSSSVTIRNVDTTPVEIGIIANVDYNGKRTSNGFIVNQQVISGYYIFNNQTVTDVVSIRVSRGIWSGNVTVKNGASLTLQAPNITINEPFTVEAGGTFILTE
jgi:nitrogen fixation protein